MNKHNCPKLRLNALLSALAAEECVAICQKLELVHLSYGEEILDTKKLIFPLSCVLALSCTNEDGDDIPLAVIGNEGVVGIHNVLTDSLMPYAATVVIPGMAMQVDYAALKLEKNSKFFSAMLAYVQHLLFSTAQIGFCNQRHNVIQRVGRAIMQLAGIVNLNKIPITHEMLAYLIGVRREVVTNATIKLREAGAITYSRGVIHVVNRPLLELLACSCERLSKNSSKDLADKNLDVYVPQHARCQHVKFEYA